MDKDVNREEIDPCWTTIRDYLFWADLFLRYGIALPMAYFLSYDPLAMWLVEFPMPYVIKAFIIQLYEPLIFFGYHLPCFLRPVYAWWAAFWGR